MRSRRAIPVVRSEQVGETKPILRSHEVPSTVEELETTRVKLTVTVPFDDLTPGIDKAYQELARSTNVPGFRKGHVPASFIDQRFGREAVLAQALDDQLSDIYEQAIKENQLSPLGQPEVEIVCLEDGQPIELTIEVDVRPEFAVPDARSMTIKVDPAIVSDETVNGRLDLLRQRFATFNDLDRAATKDDVVVFDLEASQDGKKLPDSSAKAMTYVVGAGGLVEGLDEAVTGLAAGESKAFTTKLAGGKHAGETAEVTVAVKQVQERILPKVDNDFAQLVSEYDTAAEMITGLREGLEKIELVNQANAARDKLVDTMLEAASFDLPTQLVENSLADRRQEIEDQLAKAGLSLERYLDESPDEVAKTEDEFWDDIKQRTERSLRAQILLEKAAEDEEVGVTQEELSQLIVQRAIEDGIAPEQEAQHMMEHGHLPSWLGEIRRSKTLRLLLQRADIRDTEGRKLLDLAQVRPDGSLDEPLPDTGSGKAKTPAKTATKTKKAKA